MPSTYCCVPLCKNRGGHRFPQDKELKSSWIRMIKRDRWTPSTSSVVCRSHFKETDYLQESLQYGTMNQIKRLKNGTIPTVFPWTREENMQKIERKRRYEDRNQKKQCAVPIIKKKFGSVNIENNPEFICEENVDIGHEITVVDCTPKLQENSTQTENNSDSKKLKCALIQTVDKIRFSVQNYRFDDKSIHFFTGLESFEKFNFVFSLLGPAAYSLNYFYAKPPSLEPLEMFFMTLMIFRTHRTFYEISCLYCITLKDVSNVFITWTKFMSLQWREINLWTSRSMVTYFMPLDFKNSYPTTRIMIDCTECPIKKPSFPTAQQATFSTYKNRNTVKFLIGATPSGLINYVSECYAGSTSDRQIVERCNLINLLDYGDSIMADKGFNVQDIFVTYGVTVNIPTFFKKGHQIKDHILQKDKKVASKRVHIERIIGLVKTYKILTTPMNSTETMLASDIVFVCCMLTNLRSSII